MINWFGKGIEENPPIKKKVTKKDSNSDISPFVDPWEDHHNFIAFTEKTIKEINKGTKTIDDIIANLSYDKFIRLAMISKNELSSVLSANPTNADNVKACFDAFSNMTKEEFTAKKKELTGTRPPAPKKLNPIKKAPVNHAKSRNKKKTSTIQNIITSIQNIELPKWKSKKKKKKPGEGGNTMYKIKKWLSIALVPIILAGGVWGILQVTKKSNKQIPPQGQIDPWRDNGNGKVTKPPEGEEKSVSLPDCIPQDKLDGVSYKDIAEALWNMRESPTLQETIMEMIMQWNILGIQKYIGMKENSEFANNCATGKMNKATLDKLASPFLMLDHNEILSNPNIPQDVKDAHNKFFNGQYPTNGVGYIIVSKKDMNEYLFTADHHLLKRYSILTGTQQGNSKYEWSKNPTTPIWLYRLNDIRNDDKNYHAVDGPGRFFTLLPVDEKSNFNNAYDINKYAMGIHRLYYPTGNQYPNGYDEATRATRTNALQSQNINDRLQTHGCIMMGDTECGTFNDNIAVGDLGSFVCITE